MSKSKADKQAQNNPLETGETKPPEEGAANPPETGETKPPEGEGTKPPEGEAKSRKPTVADRLVKEGLAEKQSYNVPGPGGTKVKRSRYILSPLGAALAGFNGWALNREISEADFEAGEKAFKAKKAGAVVVKKLAGKGGK